MVNGQVTSGREIKKHAAYVMQDDALYGVLTVRENLYYSAMLRLPDSMSKKGKMRKGWRERRGGVTMEVISLSFFSLCFLSISNYFFLSLTLYYR